MKKKIILSLGGVVAIATPIMTVLPYSPNNSTILEIEKNKANKANLSNLENKQLEVNRPKSTLNSNMPIYTDVDFNTEVGKHLKSQVLAGTTMIGSEENVIIFDELNQLQISNTKLDGASNFQLAVKASGKYNDNNLTIEFIQNLNFTSETVEGLVMVNDQKLELAYAMNEKGKADFTNNLTISEKEIMDYANVLFYTAVPLGEDKYIKNFLLDECVFTIEKKLFKELGLTNKIYQNVDLTNTEKGPLLESTMLYESGSYPIFSSIDEFKIFNKKLEGDREFQYSLYIAGQDAEYQRHHVWEISLEFDFANEFMNVSVFNNFIGYISQFDMFEFFSGAFLDTPHFQEATKIMLSKSTSLIGITIDFWDEDVLQNLVLDDFVKEMMNFINNNGPN